MPDLVITAANVLFTSGLKVTGVAGVAVTAGQAVYQNATDGKLYLAQCDGTPAEADAVGIALHAAGINQPLTYAPTGSVINVGAPTVKTTTYMVGAAAGGIAPQADLTAGQRITRLGYATAADGSFVVDVRHTGATV